MHRVQRRYRLPPEYQPHHEDGKTSGHPNSGTVKTARRTEYGRTEFQQMALTHQAADLPQENRCITKHNKWLTNDNQTIMHAFFWSTPCGGDRQV